MGRDRFQHESPRISTAHHAFLVFAVVACRVLVVSAFPTYDDAFITYRYAQHAAAGLGLVYNPGAPWEPVLGTTTPLYAVLLSWFARAGFDLPMASLVFNIACDALTALYLPRLFGRARAVSTWALLAFAAFPPLLRISVGGMEAPLFGLCGLLAVLAAQRQQPVRAGVFSALTCLVRPEGVILCLVVLVHAWRDRRGWSRALVPTLIPMIVIGGTAVAILSATYGSPIPQSVVAKAVVRPIDETGLAWQRTLSIWKQSFLPHAVLIPLLPLVLVGAWRALRAEGALRAYSLWALGITLAYTLARPHTWGWYFYVSLLAWSLWLAIGAERLARWVARRFGPALTEAGVSLGAPAGGVAVMLFAAVIGLRYESRVPKEVFEPLARWAEETSAREPKARVLASDIGLVGWHWKGTLLDSEGLVWPAALEYGSLNAVIEAERPEYFVFLVERTRLEHLSKRPDLRAAYEPIARYNVTGATSLDPAPEELDDVWRPDYLVYRRRMP